MKTIKITLQTRSYSAYRLVRLVGAISVTGRTITSKESDLYVGDTISEFTAKNLAAHKSYEVTVVPAK